MAEPVVEYRPIRGFDGYRVGDDGSVWSLWKHNGDLGGDWNQLIPQKATNGYFFHHLRKSRGVGRLVLLARIVLTAFRGDCPPGMESAHDDGDKANNRLSNLFWKTKKQNAADKRRHGTLPFGENHVGSKITESTALQIVEMLRSSDLSHVQIAKRLEVPLTIVRGIKAGSCWSHLTGGPIQRTAFVRRGTDLNSAKIDESIVREIRAEAISGKPFMQIGKERGLSDVQVFKIARGLSWKHVPGPVVTGRRPAGRPKLSKPV